MSKDSPIDIVMDADFTAVDLSCPEHVLWIHVCERAILDYIYFFDWYLTRYHRNLDNLVENGREFKLRCKMREELETLEWFLFSEPEAHNFAWIFDHCFRGDSNYLDSMRLRFKTLHQANQNKHKNTKILAVFINHKGDKTKIGQTSKDARPIRKMRKKFLH